MANSVKNHASIDGQLRMQKVLFNIWPSTHYCLTCIRHGQLVFASILENFDVQISFRITVYCSNASSNKLMECGLPYVRALCAYAI